MTRHAFPATCVAATLPIAGVLCFVIAAPAPAGDVPNRAEEVKVPVADGKLAEEARLKAEREMLGAEFAGLDLEKVPLKDAVDALRHATGRDIFVNWRALEAAGVSRETKVSIVLAKTTVGQAIQLLLDVAAGARDKLGAVVDDGVITISTADDLAKNTMTRVYNVRDLVAAPDLPGGEDRREQRVAALTRLITSTVASKTWRETGGTVGAIRDLQDHLIVTQTPENHKAVKALLAGLAEFVHPPADGEPKAAAPAKFPLLSTRVKEPAAK